MTANNEIKFKKWFETHTHANGKLYKDNTKKNYVVALRYIAKEMSDKISPYESIFDINDINEFDRIKNIIYSDERSDEILTYSKSSAKAGLDRYREFLMDKSEYNTNITTIPSVNTLIYNTSITSKYPLNRIIFGAPGTGKSHKLAEETEGIQSFERVTFHPDYTYANFVGTYKPTPAKDEDDKDIITYKYVPGPFMRMLVKALKDNSQAHLLIIEEINRANTAAVFGDVFQLLDRNEVGESEYEIQTSEDMRKYLARELDVDISKVANIKIPNNLFLWATMNSADQGVYPMDTAFKRRWDFEYIDIDNGESEIEQYNFIVQDTSINWNALRKAINKQLTEIGINEDKLMGAFFIAKYIIDEENDEKFINTFCNKVIMYLFEDAARQKPNRIFNLTNGKARYSMLCNDFKKKGLNIFVDAIKTEYERLTKQEGAQE